MAQEFATPQTSSLKKEGKLAIKQILETLLKRYSVRKTHCTKHCQRIKRRRSQKQLTLG